MIKRAFALASLAVALLACGAAEPQPPAGPAPPRAPAPPEANLAHQAFAAVPLEYVFTDPGRRKEIEVTFPEIDRLVSAEMAAQKLPGLVFGVVVDGDIPYAKGFGVTDVDTQATPDADTVYRIGSITKSVAALALLSLRDEGTLALEDPLSRWVPEAHGLVYPTRDAPPLNLLELLNHTSGLPEFGTFDLFGRDHPPTEKEILASLAGLPLENAPGTRSSDSNVGYALVGSVVSRAAKASFRDVVRKRILEPLGMSSTSFDPASLSGKRFATPYAPGPGGTLKKAVPWRLGAAEAAGGLYSTLHDVGRYVAFQLAAYPPRSAPETGPIRRSSVRESHLHALSLRA